MKKSLKLFVILFPVAAKYPSMFLFGKDGKLIMYEDNPENVFRIIRQTKSF
jgi:hypothetical protein